MRISWPSAARYANSCHTPGNTRKDPLFSLFARSTTPTTTTFTLNFGYYVANYSVGGEEVLPHSNIAARKAHLQSASLVGVLVEVEGGETATTTLTNLTANAVDVATWMWLHTTLHHPTNQLVGSTANYQWVLKVSDFLLLPPTTATITIGDAQTVENAFTWEGRDVGGLVNTTTTTTTTTLHFDVAAALSTPQGPHHSTLLFPTTIRNSFASDGSNVDNNDQLTATSYLWWRERGVVVERANSRWRVSVGVFAFDLLFLNGGECGGVCRGEEGEVLSPTDNMESVRNFVFVRFSMSEGGHYDPQTQSTIDGRRTAR